MANPAVEKQKNEFKRIFSLFDKNGDGLISAAEFSTFWTLLEDEGDDKFENNHR